MTPAAIFIVLSSISLANTNKAIVPNFIFEEKDGVIAIEAEYFYQQEKDSLRSWHITTMQYAPQGLKDRDANHAGAASGGAYIELLPDTKRDDRETSTHGATYTTVPGDMAVVSYKVRIKQPGRYYCWIRGYTDQRGNDDSCFLGLNGDWKRTGIGFFLQNQNRWTWSATKLSKETKRQFGEAYLDFEKPGIHTVQISMREDGAEIDCLMLTRKKPIPNEPPIFQKIAVPDSFRDMLKTRSLEKSASYISVPKVKIDAHTIESDGSRIISAQDFPKGQCYTLKDSLYLGLDPKETTKGDTSVEFPYPSRGYFIEFSARSEVNREAIHEVFVNQKMVLTCEVKAGSPKTTLFKTQKKIMIPRNSTIKVRTTVKDASGDKAKNISGQWELLRFSRR